MVKSSVKSYLIALILWQPDIDRVVEHYEWVKLARVKWVMNRAKLSLSQYVKRRLLKWLDKRVPASQEHHLNLNSIFVLPSGFGWSFIILSLCLFLLGTNYQNNLMLILSYLCLSIMLLALFYTHQNFARLALKALPVRSFHCHVDGEIQLQVIPHVNASAKACSGTLSIKWLNVVRSADAHAKAGSHKDDSAVIDKHYLFSLNEGAHPQKEQRQTLHVPLHIPRRGRFALGRMTIACDFPLGLYKCWTHLDFDQHVTVYAKPQEGPVSIDKMAANDGLDSVGQIMEPTSNEDFYALNDYEVGQPLNRVSWKHVAKNGNWVSKSFTSMRSESVMLSIPLSVDVEMAISALTYATLLWAGADRVFGIKYRGLTIAPAHGAKHMEECLSALACFNKKSSPNSLAENKPVSLSPRQKKTVRSVT